MSSLNPLLVILNHNKLTDQNYMDWNKNLFIVLTIEDYKYVLTQTCLDEPVEGSTNKEKIAYDKWSKANEMAKCYIIMSISNVL